ncbi:Putative ATP-dependent RNA helicase DHX57 [Durusdinium trenchii]|uniref:ATP-dependent RNA helicase DHX57 n=1 Tax=Durusdinium trenchii TaxID=1381693 RepID=A0ABP0I242_9DINO
MPWQRSEQESGRIVTSAHLLGNTKLQVINAYGYCRGPTWPKAKQLTENLLSTVTSHFVIGGFGIRTICGDFNFSEDELDSFEIWRQFGWVSAQRFASFHWGHLVKPTCKGATERDFIWLSPEAQALCCHIEVLDIIEHATVAVDFSCDVKAAYEDNLGAISFLINADGRSEPVLISLTLRCTFPDLAGRGEVQLRADHTTLAVRDWFKQLRRIQSLRHAIHANNDYTSAQVARCEHWSSILRARGFDKGFRTFWNIGYEDGTPHDPPVLPIAIPSCEGIDRIYATFRDRFDRLESWHIRQRCRVLKAKRDASMAGLYGELRRQPKAKPDLLWHDHYYTILDFEPSTGSLHLDRPLDLRGQSTWTINRVRTTVMESEDDLCQVSSLPTQLIPGDELHQHQVLSNLTEVHQAFVDFWRPRWNAYSDIPEEDWLRIVNFAKAHMRPISFDLPAIRPSHWQKALRRHKPTAARGVDGLDHRDFLHMPSALTASLLTMLSSIEAGAPWPSQTHTGLIQALAKTPDAHEVASFRPIVVLSLLYRTWGSIRSRQLLAQLSQYLPAEQVGFIPGQEAVGIWAYWQALVELSCSRSMAPLFWMIDYIGTPGFATGPWATFLSTMSRTFVVQGELSQCSLSTVGFPEGDALSAFAMCILDWTWHIYAQQFCPSVNAYSYVDNLGLLSLDAGSLAIGFSTMTSFFKLWRLEIDLDKSYCWAVDGDNRKALAQFPLQRLEHAKELGGSLTVGARPRVCDIKDRMSRLDDRWPVLKRSAASLTQKLLALSTVFWPEGLHGILSCRFAYSHLDVLRRKAALALGWRKAGSSPAMRFLLSDTPFSDPLLWHHKTVLMDFRRLCRKSSDFFMRWATFFSCLQWRSASGPFL